MANERHTYNCRASIFVKLGRVSEKDRDKTCPYHNWVTPCKEPVTHVASLGNHHRFVCDDGDHQESAMLEVGQVFVNEMMDLHGNIPEWKQD